MINYEHYITTGILKTPAYVFDMDALNQHLNRIKIITSNVVRLCYAMKANPFLTSYIARQLDYVEVCSLGELDICAAYCIPGEKIVFSGVNKTKDDIRKAIEYGVSVITAESLKHYMLICECCEELSYEADIYLRLSNQFQFGMNTRVLEDIIKNRKNHPSVHIEGIHYFSGTQKRNYFENLEELKYLNNYLQYLYEEYDFCVKVLEYGTGLSVPYFINQSFDDLYDGLIKLTNEVKCAGMPWKTVFEMGRYFVSGAADYATKIVDIKCTENKNYCIVDGGIHHLNYYGQNMAMRTPVFFKIANADSYEQKNYVSEKDCKWTVCGSLCTFADVLMKNVDISDVEMGDVFIFKNAGAYSIAEAPVMLLNRDFPYVYVHKETLGLRLIKESEKISKWYCDIISGEEELLL